MTFFSLTAQEKYGGLALYTVRDAMGNDASATLEAVAEAGYAYIEAAGYNDGKFYGMAPADFKSYLEGLGLKPMSSHQGSVTLENADAMIADVKAAGFEYFVVLSHQWVCLRLTPVLEPWAWKVQSKSLPKY